METCLVTSKKSKFGKELDRLLAERGMSQKSLASQIATSPAYVSSITLGVRNVSPARVSSIAAAMGVDARDMSRLHRAAAIDAGFQLDLPDDFDN